MNQIRNVYIRQSTIQGAGRGVFAVQDIRKGEIIETCPVIEISAHDLARLSESMLLTYFFFHGKHKEQALIALGFGSLYNHSYTPNAGYKIQYRQQTIEFTALSLIPKETEITFDYKSGNHKNKDPLWFEH